MHASEIFTEAFVIWTKLNLEPGTLNTRNSKASDTVQWCDQIAIHNQAISHPYSEICQFTLRQVLSSESVDNLYLVSHQPCTSYTWPLSSATLIQNNTQTLWHVKLHSFIIFSCNWSRTRFCRRVKYFVTYAMGSTLATRVSCQNSGCPFMLNSFGTNAMCLSYVYIWMHGDWNL